MRMLRWILGLTLKDRKRNDDIRRIIGVACITDKVREARLRWYGHIQRREEDDCVKRILEAGRRPWTTKSRTTEKEMDRRRQVQHGGLGAHGGEHIVPNGEREPVWLTPHQRDSQPEGEREIVAQKKTNK